MNSKQSGFFPILLVLYFAVLVISPSILLAAKWTVYEDARLIANDYNDGDSFHVMCNKHQYIFRLYYIDTPETSDSYLKRVQKQADYFGITVKQVLIIGKDAAIFTDKLLSKKIFTVYTKKEDARGNSKLRRYFAMIKVGDDWLSTLLVKEGLARIYGYPIDLPENGEFKWKYKSRLESLEKKAKKSGKGGWGYQKKKSGSSLRDLFEAAKKARDNNAQ